MFKAFFCGRRREIRNNSAGPWQLQIVFKIWGIVLISKTEFDVLLE